MEEVRDWEDGYLLTEEEMDRLAEMTVGMVSEDAYEHLYDSAQQIKKIYRLYQDVLAGKSVIEIQVHPDTEQFRIHFIDRRGLTLQ